MSAFEKEAARPPSANANQIAFDRHLSLRHWSGQDRRSASAAMDISVSRYTRRERMLELPPFRRSTRDFNPDVAEQNIRASGFRMVLCRAHKACGVVFYFWAHRGERRFISQHAVATLLRRKDVIKPVPSMPGPASEV